MIVARFVHVVNNKMFMKPFVIRLKEARNKSRLTQAEMASELGISFWTYRSYELSGKNGREPNHEMLVKISEVLNVKVGYLLGTENE